MSEHDQQPASEDYYPLRWRVADFAEDLFILHRTAALAVLAVLGAGLVLIGIVLLNNGQQTVETTLGQEDLSQPAAYADGDVDDDITDEDDTSGGLSDTSSASITQTTSSTTSTTTTTSTTEVPASSRAAASAEQLAATTPGAILDLSPASIRLTGGLPSDAVADENVALAESVFPGTTIDDQQVVDDSFPEADVVVVRLSAPDLFGYNSDVINEAYLPLIDQIATAAAANETITVEVSGHTDNTGPSSGNQLLSDRRARSAAQRLIDQGVPAARVTSVGRGEDQPIAPNTTEAGRLANRRVEFAISSA